MNVVATCMLSLLGALMISLCVVEARGWILPLCRWCVRRAVLRLPESRRERYLEEWTAHVQDLSERPITAIVWALGTRHGARKVRREMAAESVDLLRKGRPRRRRGRLRGVFSDSWRAWDEFRTYRAIRRAADEAAPPDRRTAGGLSREPHWVQLRRQQAQDPSEQANPGQNPVGLPPDSQEQPTQEGR